MARLALLLAFPVCILAQVEVDTVVDVGHRIYRGYYIPELNKLYLMCTYRLIAVDCSTWQCGAEFLTDAPYGGGRFAWNPSRRKLYAAFNYISDSSLIIDVDADTSWWILPGYYDIEYVASHDLLYGTPWNIKELWALDCATDSVVKTIAAPIPDVVFGNLTWDSVHGRVYVNVSGWGGAPRMAVYDVSTDSLLALFPTGCAPPLKLTFYDERRKAYSVSGEPFGGPCRAGVIKTDSPDTVSLLPFQSWGDNIGNLHRGPVALNTLMDKAYIGGNMGPGPLPGSCTLFVLDCATDSVIKQIVFTGRGVHTYVTWIPWSNRVYYDADDRFHMAVLDCETDSVINPELVLPGQHWTPMDLLLDPVRERILAIGADTSAIHVLREVPMGHVEEQVPRAVPSMQPRLHPNPARYSVWLGSVEPLVLYYPDGRCAGRLVPGVNDVAALPRGVYFGRSPGSGRSVRLVLIE